MIQLPPPLPRPSGQHCGTLTGARAHYTNNEKPCEPCRLAHNAYYAAYAAIPENAAKKIARRAELWQEFLDHYGHICACCGEADKRFLSIGHRSEERRVGKKGRSRWS